MSRNRQDIPVVKCVENVKRQQSDGGVMLFLRCCELRHFLFVVMVTHFDTNCPCGERLRGIEPYTRV